MTTHSNNNNSMDSLSAFRKTVMSMSTTSITKLFPAEEQQKIALQWIHEQLPDTLITDLSKDLSDGTIIITILQKITGKQVTRGLQRRASQQNKFKAIYSLENVTVALNFMVDNGMLTKQSQIGPDEICAGNTKMILAVLWAIIRHSEEKKNHEVKSQAPPPKSTPQPPQPPPQESDEDSEETEAIQPKVQPVGIQPSGSHSDDDSSDSDSDMNTLSSSGSALSFSGSLVNTLSSSGSAISNSSGKREKKARSATVSTASHHHKKEKKDKEEKSGSKEGKEKKSKKDRKDKKDRKERKEKKERREKEEGSEEKKEEKKHREHKEHDKKDDKKEHDDNKGADEQKGISRSRSFSESQVDAASPPQEPATPKSGKGFFGLTLRRNTLKKEGRPDSQTEKDTSKSTPSTPAKAAPRSPTIAQKGRSTTISSMDSKDPKLRKMFLTPPPQPLNPHPQASTTGSAPSSTTPSPTLTPKVEEHATGAPNPEGKRSSLFEGVPPTDNMTARDWAAREIYTSEILYCKHLDTIVTVYMPALKDICSPEETKFLFSNVVVLRNFGHKMLQELEDKMKNWATSTQCVGDIFLKYFPFLRAYNQYCNNYDDAVETLVECMKRPNFATFCKEQLALTPGGLGPDLQSLLINPVQRIPRYALLLKEVLQKTPKDHPDYLSLSSALDKITEITTNVNISIKQFDKSKMYDKVIATVSGIMPYMAPHRKFMMEDDVVFPSMAANNVGKVQIQYWMILFTDMLFIASGISPSDRKLEKHFPANALWVQDLPEVGDSSFELITPEETYVAQFQKAEEKKKWFASLQERTNIAFKEDVSNKPERFFEYKFPNGDLFQGDWNLGKMHGKGKYIFGNGKVYEGEFAGGFMEGFGVLDYGNGMIYTGQWKQGAPHGQGTLVQPGVHFVGEWKAGAKKKGTIEWSNQNKYSGKLKHDKLDGFGVFTCSNGDKYQGEWKADKRHGHGIYSSGLYYYEGMWAYDKKEGNGKIVYSNGDVYEGAWKNDMKHGKGKFITYNTSYNGSWVNDKKEGKGMFFLKAKGRPQKDDNDQENFVYRYDGEWKADKKSGQGMLVSADCVYEGSWLNDMKEGKGTLTDSTGSYSGFWKEDKRHGVGIFTSREGIVIRGKWQDDLRVGDGEISYTNSQGKVKVEKIRNDKLKHDDTGFNSVPPDIPNIKLFY